MKEYSWMNHPAIKDIDPAKLALLVSFSESANGKNPDMILPLLMQANSQMKSQNLNFSKTEQELLIDVLTEGMSKEDKNKVNMIKSLTSRNKKR